MCQWHKKLVAKNYLQKMFSQKISIFCYVSIGQNTILIEPLSCRNPFDSDLNPRKWPTLVCSGREASSSSSANSCWSVQIGTQMECNIYTPSCPISKRAWASVILGKLWEDDMCHNISDLCSPSVLIRVYAPFLYWATLHPCWDIYAPFLYWADSIPINTIICTLSLLSYSPSLLIRVYAPFLYWATLHPCWDIYTPFLYWATLHPCWDKYAPVGM